MSILSIVSTLRSKRSKPETEARNRAFFRGMSSICLPHKAHSLSVESGLSYDTRALNSDWVKVGGDMRLAIELFDKKYRRELEANQGSLFNLDLYTSE